MCERLEPSMPLKHGFYYCDKRFYTELLVPYFQSYSDLGAVLISGEQTDLYRVHGTRCDLLQRLTVHRQKRQKKGGQSAHRFQFLRLEQIQGYVKRIALALNRAFWDESTGKLTVEYIMVGGFGDIRPQVLACEHLLKPVLQAIKVNVAVSDMNVDKFLDACRDAQKGCDAERRTQQLARFYDAMQGGSASGRLWRECDHAQVRGAALGQGALGVPRARRRMARRRVQGDRRGRRRRRLSQRVRWCGGSAVVPAAGFGARGHRGRGVIPSNVPTIVWFRHLTENLNTDTCFVLNLQCTLKGR